ncbi:hypothetical protein [Croceibacterium aestuarii]|uniref:hypothetical protein n=1 Tax=Croceibacterium aestuarii TaxID=3064139 RepID=UPI00272DE6A5|nr:hypothetical protein [Croceibacterium sp. D39]
MSPNDIMEIIMLGITGTVAIVGISIAGWVYNTRQKIKNGYPLESMWGKPMHPQLTNEANERVKLVTQENAQLRAELGSMKDRLAIVERIVTDSGYQLGHEIDRLRDKENFQ